MPRLVVPLVVFASLYPVTPGFTCLPSDCVVPVTSDHEVMCLQ